MSKRFSKEAARRRRASLSNDSTSKTKGSGQRVEHSQAPITRAYQAWRKTNDIRCAAIKFKEFGTARPDENQDYVPQAWELFVGSQTDRFCQARIAALMTERDIEEATRMEAEHREAVLNDNSGLLALGDTIEAFTDAPVKKVRKPRAKKNVEA